MPHIDSSELKNGVCCAVVIDPTKKFKLFPWRTGYVAAFSRRYSMGGYWLAQRRLMRV